MLRRFKRKAHRASAVQQQVMGNHPPSSSTAPPGAALPRPSSAPQRELPPTLLPHASFASFISKLPPCAQRWRAHPIRILLVITPFPPPSSPAISPGGGASARHSLVSLLSALHDSLPPDESATFLSYLAADEARVCAALAQHVRHARQLAHSKRSC